MHISLNPWVFVSDGAYRAFRGIGYDDDQYWFKEKQLDKKTFHQQSSIRHAIHTQDWLCSTPDNMLSEFRLEAWDKFNLADKLGIVFG